MGQLYVVGKHPEAGGPPVCLFACVPVPASTWCLIQRDDLTQGCNEVSISDLDVADPFQPLVLAECQQHAVTLGLYN